MTDARTRRELEARAEEIEAELESRKTASQKAADRILNPAERERRGGEWELVKFVGSPDGDGAGAAR